VAASGLATVMGLNLLEVNHGRNEKFVKWSMSDKAFLPLPCLFKLNCYELMPVSLSFSS
jgi:hypothetical protein